MVAIVMASLSPARFMFAITAAYLFPFRFNIAVSMASLSGIRLVFAIVAAEQESLREEGGLTEEAIKRTLTQMALNYISLG